MKNQFLFLSKGRPSSGEVLAEGGGGPSWHEEGELRCIFDPGWGGMASLTADRAPIMQRAADYTDDDGTDRRERRRRPAASRAEIAAAIEQAAAAASPSRSPFPRGTTTGGRRENTAIRLSLPPRCSSKSVIESPPPS